MNVNSLKYILIQVCLFVIYVRGIKLRIFKVFYLVILFSLFAVQTSYAEDNTFQWKPKTSVDKDHSFTIQFNKEVDFSTVNSDTINIRKNNGEYVKISPEKGANNKTVIVKAPNGGYEEGIIYTLSVQNIKDKDGHLLNKKVNMKFTTGDTMLSYAELTLTSIDDIIKVPDEIQVLKNNNLESPNVKWDFDKIEMTEQENVFYIPGEVEGIDKKGVLKVVLDKSYVNALIGNLTFQTGENYGDPTKIIEFLTKEFLDGKITLKSTSFMNLVADHLKGAQLQMAYKAFIQEHLYGYFDRQDKTQASIAGCLSDLMVNRAFLNINEGTKVSTQECLDTIFGYIDEVLGIKSKDITTEHLDIIHSKKTTNFDGFLRHLNFEINGLKGTWYMKNEDGYSNLIIFDEEKNRKFEGDMYVQLDKHIGTGTGNKVSVTATKKSNNSIELKFYYSMKHMVDLGLGWYEKFGKGDKYYYSLGELDDSQNILKGYYYTMDLYRNTGRFAQTNNKNPFTLIKVKDPGLFGNEFKYLEKLRNNPEYFGY